jgi:aminopeptidase 2
VVEEAQRRFKKWVEGDHAALPPVLRRVVFCIVLSEDPSDADYEAIFATYKTSQSADGKELALSSIGDVKEPRLVQRTIDFIFSGDIPAQDIHGPCNSLASNSKTRNLWWDTMKEHWRYPFSKADQVHYTNATLSTWSFSIDW